jgi:hypothetical protein
MARSETLKRPGRVALALSVSILVFGGLYYAVLYLVTQ